MDPQEAKPTLSGTAEKPEPSTKSTVNILSTVYHRNPGENPITLETNMRHELVSDEQPYQRRCRVGEEWEPLDFGWLAPKDGPLDVGSIHIVNEEGKFLQKQPTPEQRAKTEAKILEIRVTPDNCCWGYFLIAPGQPFYNYPTQPKDLQIRCQKGIARFTITVFPK